MLDNPIIDIGIGLLVLYVLLSLVVSSVQEWVASLFAMRSKNLHQGIKRLIGHKYAEKVYGHPKILNLSKKGRKPSYIDTSTLSTVLLNIVAKDAKQKLFSECSPEEVRDMVNQIDKDKDHPLYGICDMFLDETDKNTDARERLKKWFDEGMERISGWYKRKARLLTCLIAIAVTACLNASTVHISESLWEKNVLRSYAVEEGSQTPSSTEAGQVEKDRFKHLLHFPIGWSCLSEKEEGFGGNKQWRWSCLPRDASEWTKTLFGWFLTIAAISLGAPFWFDLLGKVANLKS